MASCAPRRTATTARPRCLPSSTRSAASDGRSARR
jgi:hypothetical protein